MVVVGRRATRRSDRRPGRWLGAAALLPVTALLAAGALSPSAASTSGSFAATDAPAKVRVGAPTQKFVVTAIVPRASDEVYVELLQRDGESLAAFGYAEEPELDRPLVMKVPVVLADLDVRAWGPGRWRLTGYDDFGHDRLESHVAVDVRAHSMLGLATSRSGSTVTVRGSLRAYATTVHRYASWSGRPVSIQRWDGSTWRQVAGTTTDRNGNLTARLSVPRGSSLRLVTPDTPAIWGATSAQRTS